MAILASYFRSINHFKKFAKELSKTSSLSLSQSQEIAAKMSGFLDFHHAIKELSKLSDTTSKNADLTETIALSQEVKINTTILDFGGSIDSWQKLCSVVKATTLRFGNVNPPILNPFQLSLKNSQPTLQGNKIIAKAIDRDANDESIMSMIKFIYLYMNSYDAASLNRDFLISCFPVFKRVGYEEMLEILKLKPGTSKPGEKALESIRTVLELILANSVTVEGSSNNVWNTFLLDDINETIDMLYEDYRPPANNPNRWPQISDFMSALERLNALRASGNNLNKWKSRGVFNYDLLMSRLSIYCEGGVDHL